MQRRDFTGYISGTSYVTPWPRESGPGQGLNAGPCRATPDHLHGRVPEGMGPTTSTIRRPARRPLPGTGPIQGHAICQYELCKTQLHHT